MAGYGLLVRHRCTGLRNTTNAVVTDCNVMTLVSVDLVEQSAITDLGEQLRSPLVRKFFELANIPGDDRVRHAGGRRSH